jgi:hypothetical protein
MIRIIETFLAPCITITEIRKVNLNLKFENVTIRDFYRPSLLLCNDIRRILTKYNLRKRTGFIKIRGVSKKAAKQYSAEM